MAKAAQAVQQCVQEINAEMRSLQSSVEPLGASWQGSAYQAFQQLMQRFQDDGQKLTQALDAIGNAIDSNQKNYTATEETNQGSISKLLSGLQ